ncbi:BTAD domain-containing putative transcriptional regulator [Kineosporia sp. NBRC 101731]|uniref:AfsR/SARP family transcriptional regulator n=1 Tax=Kineosporia sp. NBRC 101731 TaxID=3032199 RepID=UPI002554B757|nr:BTAD domain-containing putative transcriptional regulator [Kineosporia sp. NBRC 101731]
MYLLDLPPEAIDSRRFEEASESGRSRLAAGDPVGAAHELRSALQLWRGTTLPDLAGVPGAVASVARLESLRQSTIADRIDAESLLGRHSRLIPELQDLVRRHALNERFVGQLMTSLYWEGRQAEALAAYAAAAGRLGDELGIDPGPALRELHGRLLRQELGPVTPARETDVESPSFVDGWPLRPAPVPRAVQASLLTQGSDSVRLEAEFNSRMVNRLFPGRIPGPRSGGAPMPMSTIPVRPRGAPAALRPGPAPAPPEFPGEESGLPADRPRSSADPGGPPVVPGGSGAVTESLFTTENRTDGDGAGEQGAGSAAAPAPASGDASRPGISFVPGSSFGTGISFANGTGVRSRAGGVTGAGGGSGAGSGSGVGNRRVSGARGSSGVGRVTGPGNTPSAGAHRPGRDHARFGQLVPKRPETDPTIPNVSVNLVPRPPTLSTGPGAPVLPGMPGVPDGDGLADTGGIPVIGTKRTAFGTAFGAGTIGRTVELGTALELLRRPDVRLVTIAGPGGAGKTRLAAQVVARRLADRARDAMSGPRVLVVPLGGLHAGDSTGDSGGAGLAERLRRVLGVVPDFPGEAPLDTVCRALAATPCLLVLDDLELGGAVEAGQTSHPPRATRGTPLPVGSPVDTVTALITRVGGLRVLATSRRPLGVPGEQVVGLGPLSLPWAGSGADDVDMVRSSDAVRLFRDRARAVLPAFEVTGENAGPVSELCRALDGLPLALELAAARSRGRAPDLISAELDEARRRPGGMLGPVLSWTVNLLDDTERLVLSQLSVFVGGATLEAAEWVCGPVPGPGQVIDVIGRLADKNLLLIDETGRLGMLSPVREYARGLLAADPGQEAACSDRHAAWFAEFADALPPVTDRWLDPAPVAAGAGPGRAIEFDNLTSAAARAQGRDGELFARLVVALLDQGAGTGRWDLGDASTWLDQARAGQSHDRTTSRLLIAGGCLALFGGNPRRALEILADCPTSGDPVNAVRTALMRAVAARSLGRNEEALAELEGALDQMRAVRRLPDTLWHAVVNTLADVLDELGRTAAAIGHWQRSRHRAAAEGDPARLAYPLAMLAQAAQDRGEERLSQVLITQARTAAESGGPAIRAAVAVTGGVLELRGGDSRQAVQSLRTGLREAHRAGRYFTLPRIAGLLGAAHSEGDPERAATLLGVSSAWCAERSLVVTGHREREIIERAESGLTRAARPSDTVRRAAARGAAVPFGSLTGLLRLDPADRTEPEGPAISARLIDLTGEAPRVRT